MAKINYKFQHLIPLLGLGYLIFYLPPALAQNNLDQSIFRTCAKEIEQKINPELLREISLRLPIDFNIINGNINEENCQDYLKVSSSLIPTEPSITLSVFNCKNHNAQGCLIGSFSVDKNTNINGRQQWQNHQGKGSVIFLTDNIQGYLLNELTYPIEGIPQNINSNFSTLMWQQENNLYTVKLNNNFPNNIQQVATLTAQSEAFSQIISLINQPQTSPQSRGISPPQRLENELAAVRVTKLRDIKVFGSTVFEQNQINETINDLIGTEINNENTISLILGEAVNRLTNLYVTNDYVTSKAELVTTDSAKELLSDGVGVIRIIEGGLSNIEIEGAESLHSYILSQVEPRLTTPLDAGVLEDVLRTLEQNPQIERVDGSLRGSNEEGKSELVLRVVPKPNFSSSVVFDNYSAPSVGSERFGVNLSYNNLLGFGDQLSTFYNISNTGGNKNLEISYSLPLSATGGTLLLRANPSWSSITQAPFDELDIRGQKETYEITYQQPLIKNFREELAIGLGFIYENGQTFVFDQPSPFGIGPSDDGRSVTNVLHFTQNYINRSPSGVWFLQSRFNFGLDLFDATINEANQPDGEFFSWLGKIQRLQKLGDDHLLVIQGDLQLTPNSLLGSQQYGIGGGTSVRGYRNSLRSGDNGFRFSIEDQITILRNENKESTLIFAPFFDLGTIWNNPNNPNELLPEKLLIGVGFGLEWRPFPSVSLRFDYGYPFTNVADRGNNIQDEGIYFQFLYKP
jgi:hemolysin activation/secretion protein